MEHLGTKQVHQRVLCPSGLRRSCWPKNYDVSRFRYAPLSLQRLACQKGGIPQALRENRSLSALVPPFLASMAFHTVVAARQCDLIHAHWSICGALAVLTRTIHRKPVVTTLRGTDVRWGEMPGPYKWLHEICIRKSTFTVAVGREIVAKLRNSYPRIGQGLVFIPNGVGKAFYEVDKSALRPALQLDILFIGNLVPTKGVETLIRALALIEKSKRVRLTIAGDGPDRDRLMRLSRACGVESRTEFLGTIPPGDVPSLMSRHHVLVLPSLSEGRPNVILEAMAAGLPVVGTDIRGIRELVQDGKTGWIYPLGDSPILASVLEDLCDGTKDGEAAGREGRKWMFEEGLTWERTASRYRDLYYQAVENRKLYQAEV